MPQAFNVASQSATASEPAVRIQGVSYTYPATGIDSGAVQALDSIDLNIQPRTKLGILGPNGGGKSTLIKLILGILKPSKGSISIFNNTPTKARNRGLIGYLPQRIEADLDWPISVREVVKLARTCSHKPWAKPSPEDREAIDRSLELVDLQDLADRPIGALSGGQLQRAMIARAIAIEPKLLVLDEPMVGVDIAGQQRFGQLINTLQERLGLTVIVVSHDMRAIAAVADRVACLSRTLHFHDAPEGLSPAVLAQVFAHDVAGVFGDIHIDAHRAEDCDDPSHNPCGCDHTDQSTENNSGGDQ